MKHDACAWLAYDTVFCMFMYEMLDSSYNLANLSLNGDTLN